MFLEGGEAIPIILIYTPIITIMDGWANMETDAGRDVMKTEELHWFLKSDLIVGHKKVAECYF